jgi:hypothetical protein
VAAAASPIALNAALKRNNPMTVPARKLDVSSQPGIFLGPSVVIEVEGPEVVVALPQGERARARVAFAFPYACAKGDDVLVIGNETGEHWIIGVLRSSGKASLEFPGDLDVRSVGGKLTLSGDKGVAIDAPDVEMRAAKLRIFAGSVLRHAQSVVDRVRELYSMHAGQSNTIVEGTALTQAGRAKIITEETVTINGREIHLG